MSSSTDYGKRNIEPVNGGILCIESQEDGKIDIMSDNFISC